MTKINPLSDELPRILEVIRTAPEPIHGSEIARRAGIKVAAIYDFLHYMVEKELLLEEKSWVPDENGGEPLLKIVYVVAP